MRVMGGGEDWVVGPDAAAARGKIRLALIAVRQMVTLRNMAWRNTAWRNMAWPRLTPWKGIYGWHVSASKGIALPEG